MFIIYKAFYEKKSSKYHFCSNVKNSEDSNYLQSNYLTFWLSFYIYLYILEKYF
jgi:hypothetical protein